MTHSLTAPGLQSSDNSAVTFNFLKLMLTWSSIDQIASMAIKDQYKDKKSEFEPVNKNLVQWS